MLLLLALLLSDNTGGAEQVRASVDDVQLLQCELGSGSVFRISGDRFVTATHVGSRCSIGGAQVSGLFVQRAQDMSLFSTSRGTVREFEIDCGGFKTGEVYRAIGWAFGRDLLAIPLVATDKVEDRQADFLGQRILYGRIWAGMSGGPIVNRAGKVVGINNGSSSTHTWSRPLSTTALCR